MHGRGAARDAHICCECAETQGHRGTARSVSAQCGGGIYGVRPVKWADCTPSLVDARWSNVGCLESIAG